MTSLVGMVVFLGSWTMMFIALFFSLGVARLSAPVWPPVGLDPLPLALPVVATILITLSSFTLSGSVRAFRGGRRARCRGFFVGTFVLGLGFLALQVMVWSELWASGLRFDSGKYGAFYYLLTVFHGLHAAVGLGWLALLFPSLKKRGAGGATRLMRVRMAAMFWHFVDVMWLLTFVLVYVI